MHDNHNRNPFMRSEQPKHTINPVMKTQSNIPYDIEQTRYNSISPVGYHGVH